MAGITNEELIQKAVITTDALVNQGKLNPAQSDAFIDFVIEETMLKNNARMVRFRNETLQIDKIGIGKRLAVPKAEAKDPNIRRGVQTSKVELTPREVMVPFEIGDVFREVNIEGDAVEEHIIRMMAAQTANDTEELYINGDKNGHAVLEGDIKEGGSTTEYIKDSYLGLQDGWSRLADGANLVDAQGQNVGLNVFGQMLRAMPTKFRRNLSNLRFFLSPDLWQLFIEKLATRATGLGDRATEGMTHTPFGVPAVPVPLWQFQPPIVEHIVLNGTTAVGLRNAPVTDVVVTTFDLAQTPAAAFVESTDYTLDAAAGTVARIGAGAIGDGDTVKVTYKANPQIILTHQQNFIVGIGRAITLEKDRDIYAGLNQYAISFKVAVEFEELDAIVKANNVGTGV